MSEKKEFSLDIGIPNGIILIIIGCLVILTPVVHTIAREGVIIDVAAGSILVLIGCVSLFMGLRKKKM